MQEYVYIKIKKENVKDISPLKIVEEINANFVYDNGETLLGEVKNVINYIQNNMEYTSEEDIIFYDLLNELKEDYAEDTIVCINLSNGIGYSIDWWEKDTKVEI